jgi:hypothetical protein
LDLLACDPVVDRSTYVGAQLVWAVEYREHRQGQHAAGFSGEAVSIPDTTPAVLGDEFLKRFGELVAARGSGVDVGGTKYFSPDLVSPVVGVVVHVSLSHVLAAQSVGLGALLSATAAMPTTEKCTSASPGLLEHAAGVDSNGKSCDVT